MQIYGCILSVYLQFQPSFPGHFHLVICLLKASLKLALTCEHLRSGLFIFPLLHGWNTLF